jgi:hypothetical protein
MSLLPHARAGGPSPSPRGGFSYQRSKSSPNYSRWRAESCKSNIGFRSTLVRILGGIPFPLGRMRLRMHVL